MSSKEGDGLVSRALGSNIRRWIMQLAGAALMLRSANGLTEGTPYLSV
ncbi:MAG TPA: hypothetical protein VMF91_02440 [Bryobacteraceae bacterium]|nr:hypothetical protein [Bryobacteraceae bacterium]